MHQPSQGLIQFAFFLTTIYRAAESAKKDSMKNGSQSHWNNRPAGLFAPPQAALHIAEHACQFTHPSFLRSVSISFQQAIPVFLCDDITISWMITLAFLFSAFHRKQLIQYFLPE